MTIAQRKRSAGLGSHKNVLPFSALRFDGGVDELQVTAGYS